MRTGRPERRLQQLKREITNVWTSVLGIGIEETGWIFRHIEDDVEAERSQI